MPSTIKHKRSTTAGAVPAAGALVEGELAINVADGRVFAKKANGSVVCVSAEPGNKGQIEVINATDWRLNANSVELISLVEASSPSMLIGRRSASAGRWEEITLGSGLSMDGTQLKASPPSVTAEDDQIILAMRVFA